MSKNIIILQHIPIETPGYILDLMKTDKFNITTIELDQGEKIPDNLSSYDAMFCMGGPMDTWMEETYPWLIDEKNNDVKILASSATTKYQIFKYMDHAYGIQFHIEIKEDTVSQWSCVPEYEKALEDSLGKGALKIFDQNAKINMKLMNTSAEILYKNFKKII